jgi:hypothetical protein
MRGHPLFPALLAACTLAGVETDPGPAQARCSVNVLHQQLATRFVDPHGLLFDYVRPGEMVAIPTPEECRAGRPNALAWWTPIENGAFFTGLWLDALVQRWEATRDPVVAERARAAATGLLLLSTVGKHPAFIARGVSTDGSSHYAAGSDDQTLPWFYGLWRYLKSPLPTADERARLVAALVRVAEGLRGNGWQMPCDPPGLGNRGGWGSASPVNVPRLLFVLRALHDLTGDQAWLGLYRSMRDASPPGATATRLDICATGDLVGEHASPEQRFFMLWTKGSTAACLAALTRLEDEPIARERFRAGLLAFARHAATCIADRTWDGSRLPHLHTAWRDLDGWRKQNSVTDMVAVANQQGGQWARLSPRKPYEHYNMAEPLFACWIVALSGEAELVNAHAPAIRAALCRYRWEDIGYATMFAGELAWWHGRAWLE